MSFGEGFFIASMGSFVEYKLESEIEFVTTREKVFTIDNLKDWPDEFELIEGEMIPKMSPSGLHSWIQHYLKLFLGKLDPREEFGLMLTEPSIKLDKRNVPQPDLAFWTASRQPPINLEVIEILPDLVVEIWSPHDLDGPKQRKNAIDKIRRYQAAGIPNNWVINPLDQTAAFYVPGRMEPNRFLQKNEELSFEEVIPGFKLPLKDLFPGR